MEHKDHYVRFLVLLRVLVNETRKGEPLSRAEIIRRCKEGGAEITEFMFNKDLRRMKEAGIVIRHETEVARMGSRNLYWYDEGWI